MMTDNMRLGYVLVLAETVVMLATIEYVYKLSAVLHKIRVTFLLDGFSKPEEARAIMASNCSCPIG